MSKFVAKFSDSQALYFSGLQRFDIGVPVPDDGYEYVMAQHEIIMQGFTRHSTNKPNDRSPRPAIVNREWGIKTLAQSTGDNVEIKDDWQWWYYNFWDYHSGEILPVGEKTGEYTEPRNNQSVIYTSYTPGSKLALYSGLIKDAKSNTDAGNPETGARDVVTRRNLNAKKNWQWLCRPTTGALLRV